MNIDLIRPKRIHHKIFITNFLVGIAFALHLSILPIDGRVVFSTFYPAIAITALLCGYRFALASLLLGGGLAYFYFLPPFQTFKFIDFEQGIALVTYLVAALTICFSFSVYSNDARSKFFKPQGIVPKALVLMLLIGFAFLLRITLLSTDSRVIYSTFYPAIAGVTLVCGFKAGLIGTLIASLLVYFYMLPPFQSLKLLNMEQATGMATFFMASGIICVSLREVIHRGQKIKQVNDTLRDLMTTNSVGKTLGELVQVIASTVEMRDPYTSGHQKRVADLGVAIGTKMGLPERNLMGIKLAGLIHDLGKMSIPIEILTKPGKLTPIEQSLIREHPKVAHDALVNFQAPWPLADIILQHHERLDGTGYPNRIKGDNILIEARILAVADVVEAMSAMRPYREGLGIRAALDEVKKHARAKYDPAVVDVCVSLFETGEFEWRKC
jgi:hypothetical protein